MRKLTTISTLSTLILSASLNAFGFYDTDINKEIEHNRALIKKYEDVISGLKRKNQKMLDEKAKHPERYVKKSLYEDLSDKYIYRIKLNGAKADALNFMVKDNIVSVSMDMKREEKSDNGYFYSSQYFSTSYSIPKDVKQDAIKHKTEGDYFPIVMPKK